MNPTAPNQDTTVLFMALELSSSSWKVAFSAGGRNPRLRDVEACDVKTLLKEVAKAKKRFALAPETPVVSCYEAGRDGFWIHRKLRSVGIENLVVDSSSIQVDRRARRAKTDRLDVGKLLSQLMRHSGGEKGVWRVVNVPSERDEDERRPVRELQRLKKERTQHGNRIRGLLATRGVRAKGRLATLLPKLTALGLPEHLHAEIERERLRLELVDKQIREAERALRERLQTPQSVCEKKVAALSLLRGIGERGAWVLVTEFFGWRRFANRRQVGACAGLTGTPFASGETKRDQGISKAGNARVRTLMIQLAWLWLRYQPDSALAKWWKERFSEGGSRVRRIGIVALARRLLIAFWRFFERGEVPEGARLKLA